MTDLDISQEYEASSGPICTVEVPYDRMSDATPTLHKPAWVLGAATPTIGDLTGTLISLDATNSIAVINTAHGAQYYHKVRNVVTYAQGAESTFTQLNFGMPVYYDPSSTMPAGYHLSLSPLDENDVVNPLFGHIVWSQTEIADGFSSNADPYPTGSAVAGTSHDDICVQQK